MRTIAGVALAIALAVAGCGGRQEDETQAALSANGADRACRCYDVHTQLAMPDGCVAARIADGSFAALGGAFLYTMVNPPMSERVVDAVAQPVETVRAPAPVHVAKR